MDSENTRDVSNNKQKRTDIEITWAATLRLSRRLLCETACFKTLSLFNCFTSALAV